MRNAVTRPDSTDTHDEVERAPRINPDILEALDPTEEWGTDFYSGYGYDEY